MWLATVSMRPIPRGTVMLLASRTRACCAAALVLTTVTAPAPAAAQQRSFTIEQALSAPFPDELVAAPAGRSGEGRVGEKSRTRGAADYLKKKKQTTFRIAIIRTNNAQPRCSILLII